MKNALVHLWQLAVSRHGSWLTNRAIRFLGHLVAMIVMMKLTWMGGMLPEYFLIYCGFIAGDASLAQALRSDRSSEPAA